MSGHQPPKRRGPQTGGVLWQDEETLPEEGDVPPPSDQAADQVSESHDAASSVEQGEEHAEQDAAPRQAVESAAAVEPVPGEKGKRSRPRKKKEETRDESTASPQEGQPDPAPPDVSPDAEPAFKVAKGRKTRTPAAASGDGEETEAKAAARRTKAPANVEPATSEESEPAQGKASESAGRKTKVPAKAEAPDEEKTEPPREASPQSSGRRTKAPAKVEPTADGKKESESSPAAEKGRAAAPESKGTVRPKPPPARDWVRAALAAAAVVQAAARGAPTILAWRSYKPGVAGPSETRDEFLDRIQPAVEALIFAADHPLSVKELVQVLVEEGEMLADSDAITEVIQRLQSRYAQPRSGLVMLEVAGGWAIRTSHNASKYLQRAHDEKPFKLGRAALEALAIVAYRQPVTKPQIDELRGVDSAGALKSLLDRGLVKILGKAEDVGRPMLYGTTKGFLEAFNLRSLTELPTLREYHELNAEHQALVDAQAPRLQIGKISDLARPDARLVSEQAESEGSHAMAELDRAMGEASASTRTAEALLKAGGKLPPGVKLETIRRPDEADGAQGEPAGAVVEDASASAAQSRTADPHEDLDE